MIFVTVGTHEQQFNRLIEYMDIWAKDNDEDVIIQTGFSTYDPLYAKSQKLFGYKEMSDLIQNARIIITHGGPSSFIVPIQIGKIPIVVPRKKEFYEHVNNHQVTFCREVVKRQKNIIEVEDIEQLSEIIYKYNEIAAELKNSAPSNNENFCKELERIVESMLN